MKLITSILKSGEELERLDNFCEEDDNGDLQFTDTVLEIDSCGFDFKELVWNKRFKIFEDENETHFELQWFCSISLYNDDYSVSLECVNNKLKLTVIELNSNLKDKGTYWRFKDKFEVICQRGSATEIDSNILCLGEVGDVYTFIFENNSRLEKWVSRLIRAKKVEDK